MCYVSIYYILSLWGYILSLWGYMRATCWAYNYIRVTLPSLWGYRLSLWGCCRVKPRYMAAQIKQIWLWNTCQANILAARIKLICWDDAVSAQAMCVGIKMPTVPSRKTVCSSARRMSAVTQTSAAAVVRHMLIRVFATRRTRVHGCTRESGTPATFTCWAIPAALTSPHLWAIRHLLYCKSRIRWYGFE